MKDNGTRIGVIVTTYNWPEALTLCIKSIFRQTRLPDEIIIADDGSGDPTRRTIEQLKLETRIPIKHIWHEDNGFRLSEIRNKAIISADADYLIQTDGDCILSRHFVEDHIRAAERGCFVCGSRVHLPEKQSRPLLKNAFQKVLPTIRIWPSNPDFLNSLRLPPLSLYMERRYGKKIDHLRGCNMAFWKSDLIRVNGYDEALTGWGHEDSELAWRLHFAGVQKKFLKFAGVVYHIYHKENTRNNEGTHVESINEVMRLRSSWCDNGMTKKRD